MTKPDLRIRITGTRTGKLRARVEREGEPRFEITIGGKRWKENPPEIKFIRHRIQERATVYINNLAFELAESRR